MNSHDKFRTLTPINIIEFNAKLDSMILGSLISVLNRYDKTLKLRLGFHKPHSHRGDYSQLAFELKFNVTIGEMLVSCHEALDNNYTGWKGGEYTMNKYSDVCLAVEGRVGTEISELLLDYMLGDTL